MTAPPSPSIRSRGNPILALTRMIFLFLGSLVILLLFLTRRACTRSLATRFAVATRWTHIWARYCCWCAGYQVKLRGALPAPGTFLTPNHLGYVDIWVLASVIPVFFVAKADIANWPFIGFLTRASDHVFASRRRGKDVQSTAECIRERLAHGQCICAFLEGTSSGGGDILPFHSSFLQPAIDAEAEIIPVAFRWHARDNRVQVAEDIAYWKDHVLLPHLWHHLGLTGLTVEVVVAEPVPSGGRDRKGLARQLQATVSQLAPK